MADPQLTIDDRGQTDASDGLPPAPSPDASGSHWPEVESAFPADVAAVPLEAKRGPTDVAATAGEESGHFGRLVIETLQAVVAAFILAFLFRGFLVEPFVIPTGSMAPTLRGAHLLKRGPETGYSFAVGPVDTDFDHVAQPLQNGPFQFGDPMLAWAETQRDRERANNPQWDDDRRWRGWSRRRPEPPPKPGSLNTPVRIENEPVRLGDRILVLKYLYLLHEPRRFDVVVFKNPTNPEENFIKRLIGLPGEMLWLLDGDVFTAPATSTATGGEGGFADPADWEREAGSLRIQRKPISTQEHLWIPIFDSAYIPANAGDPASDNAEGEQVRGGEDRAPALLQVRDQSAGLQRPDVEGEDGRPTYVPPWDAFPASEWSLADRRSYRLHDAVAADLRFRTDLCPLDDRLAYNVTLRNPPERVTFNVSDLRVATAIRPDREGLAASFRLEAHRHVFEAVIETDGTVILRMRPQEVSAWRELARVPGDAEHPRLPAHRTTPVEFWHVDQTLMLWVNHELVATGEYDWSAAERLAFAYGWTVEELAREPDHALVQGRNEPSSPELSLHFEGSEVTLHRVRIDRDLYYRPQLENDYGPPARGTHPQNLARLQPDQFFMCGDNSAASHDSRRLGDPVPWVGAMFDVAPGIVPRDLLLGRAFLVYFPSPESVRPTGGRLVPNFGEMRFIR